MMREPLTITYPITTQEIAQLARREKDGRVRQRLTAMKFISKGQTIPQVARRMEIAERPLRKWLHRLNEQGPKGLGDAPRSGQPPKLDTKQIEAFKQRVRQGATKADPVCSLRGKDWQRILQQEFNASYSLGGTYFLLHRLGFSCLCPRPRHPQADGEEQETFKKSPSRGHGAAQKPVSR